MYRKLYKYICIDNGMFSCTEQIYYSYSYSFLSFVINEYLAFIKQVTQASFLFFSIFTIDFRISLGKSNQMSIIKCLRNKNYAYQCQIIILSIFVNISHVIY